MGVFDQIKEDWAVLKRAPMVFASLLIAGLALGFTGGTMWSARRVEIAEALTQMREAELATMRQQKADEEALRETLRKMKSNTLQLPFEGLPKPVAPPPDPNAPISIQKSAN